MTDEQFKILMRRFDSHDSVLNAVLMGIEQGGSGGSSESTQVEIDYDRLVSDPDLVQAVNTLTGEINENEASLKSAHAKLDAIQLALDANQDSNESDVLDEVRQLIASQPDPHAIASLVSYAKSSTETISIVANNTKLLLVGQGDTHQLITEYKQLLNIGEFAERTATVIRGLLDDVVGKLEAKIVDSDDSEEFDVALEAVRKQIEALPQRQQVDLSSIEARIKQILDKLDSQPVMVADGNSAESDSAAAESQNADTESPSLAELWVANPPSSFTFEDGVIRKSSGDNEFDAQVISRVALHGDGVLSWTIPSAEYRLIFGVTDQDNSTNWKDVAHGIYFSNNSMLRVYEYGRKKTNYREFAAGDMIEIRFSGESVEYIHRNDVICSSSRVDAALTVDSSFRDIGSAISNVVLSGDWK